jgi:hypothetical protein
VLFSHWTVSRRANYHCRKSQSEHVLAPPWCSRLLLFFSPIFTHSPNLMCSE